MANDPTRSNPPAPDEDSGGNSSERRLAEVLWSYLDRINAGEPVDATQIEHDHPDLAAELIMQIHAFRDLGRETVGVDVDALEGTASPFMRPFLGLPWQFADRRNYNAGHLTWTIRNVRHNPTVLIRRDHHEVHALSSAPAYASGCCRVAIDGWCG